MESDFRVGTLACPAAAKQCLAKWEPAAAGDIVDPGYEATINLRRSNELRHFPLSPRAGGRDASLAARVLTVNHGPSQTQADKNRRIS